jgi:hypothetical protein
MILKSNCTNKHLSRHILQNYLPEALLVTKREIKIKNVKGRIFPIEISSSNSF